MKWFLFLSIFITTNTMRCQSKASLQDPVHAVFLDAVKTEVFKEEFRICDFECNEVNVFDFNNVIDDSPLNFSICDKIFHQYNTVSLDHPAPSSIVIYRLDAKDADGKITIYFLRPYSGASVILTYQVEDRVKLIETRIGTF